MKPERFKGEVLEGHKGFAIEVPFNPETKWKSPPVHYGAAGEDIAFALVLIGQPSRPSSFLGPGASSC